MLGKGGISVSQTSIFVLLSNSHGGQWHCSMNGYSLVLYQKEINGFI